jgi:hypothetical protein
MRLLVSLAASPVVLTVACGGPPPAPSVAASAAVAPAAADAAPTSCDAPAYHRLDFWIGAWDVSDPSGAYDGTNVVERALGGCAIAEHWIDARGRAGESLFYVDRASGTWRQLWVTDEGTSKEKREAAAPPGAIAFEGARDRTTLAPIEHGEVRQVIVSRDGRASWTGIYARHPKACDAPENHQMDFWLGDWKVTVRSRASLEKDEWATAAGSNHVTSILNGCAIEEHFTAENAPGPGTWSGRSHSTWVAAEKRWRQTWGDDSGSYLAFAGGREGEDFVLVGEPRPNGRVMRMVFTNIARDGFAWRWEASTDGQKTWKAMMTIDYVRIPAG